MRGECQSPGTCRQLQVIYGMSGTSSVPPRTLTSRSRIQGVSGSKPGNRILRSFSSRIKTFTLEKTAGGEFVTPHAHLPAAGAVLLAFSPSP